MLINLSQSLKALLAIPATAFSLTVSGIVTSPCICPLSAGEIFPLSSILQEISFVALLSLTKLLWIFELERTVPVNPPEITTNPIKNLLRFLSLTNYIYFT